MAIRELSAVVKLAQLDEIASELAVMLTSVQMRASCFRLFCDVATPPFTAPIRFRAVTAAAAEMLPDMVALAPLSAPVAVTVAPWTVPLLLTLLGAIGFPLMMFAAADAAFVAPVPPLPKATIPVTFAAVPILLAALLGISPLSNAGNCA
jgi:hypothetical protein